MNAVGDLCRGILLLVDDPGRSSPEETSPMPEERDEATAEEIFRRTRGHHVACVVSAEERTVPCLVAAIRAFAEVAACPVALHPDVEAATSSSLAEVEAWLRASTDPLCVLRCTSAELRERRAALLRATRRPYPLLVVLDLTRTAPAETREEDALAWLRPCPSDVSERRWVSTGGMAISEAAEWVLPVQMYCLYPVLRDRGAVEGSRGPWGHPCTLEAILREVTFKAGRFPKYGA